MINKLSTGTRVHVYGFGVTLGKSGEEKSTYFCNKMLGTVKNFFLNGCVSVETGNVKTGAQIIAVHPKQLRILKGKTNDFRKV